MFVQQPDDKVCVIKKFSRVDKRHAVRTGAQLVGNVRECTDTVVRV